MEFIFMIINYVYGINTKENRSYKITDLRWGLILLGDFEVYWAKLYCFRSYNVWQLIKMTFTTQLIIKCNCFTSIVLTSLTRMYLLLCLLEHTLTSHFLWFLVMFYSLMTIFITLYFFKLVFFLRLSVFNNFYKT